MLTLTSVPGVRAVLLERDGRVVDAPLPDGSLTPLPLTRQDYAPLLDPAG